MTQPLLTSNYYLIRLAKSKDMFDLMDAWKAYIAFKKDRRDYAVKHYAVSAAKLDPVGVMESFLIPIV